jgi:hypothetical protein
MRGPPGVTHWLGRLPVTGPGSSGVSSACGQVGPEVCARARSSLVRRLRIRLQRPSGGRGRQGDGRRNRAYRPAAGRDVRACFRADRGNECRRQYRDTGGISRVSRRLNICGLTVMSSASGIGFLAIRIQQSAWHRCPAQSAPQRQRTCSRWMWPQESWLVGGLASTWSSQCCCRAGDMAKSVLV